MGDKMQRRRSPKQEPPGSDRNPPPGKRELNSKRARIERQKARAESWNNPPDWFGVPGDSPPGRAKEDRFESVPSLFDSTELGRRQSTIFTGFRESRVMDMLVILGLWSVRLFIPWVEAWHEFNLHLLMDPFHWAQLVNYFAFHETMVFIAKCLLCLAISLLVDFTNFKYPTYFIILTVYILTPIVGVAIIGLLGARNYDRAWYFEWWHKTVVMMMWAMSVPFVSFPLQFSCIFNQVKGMSRLAHYNWTAIFVFVEALNACIAYWTIPPNCPTGWFTLIGVWCAIGVLILVMIIEVLSLMRCAKPQIMRFNYSTCKKTTTEPTNGTSTESKAERSGSDPKTDLVTKVLTKPSMIEVAKPENGPPQNLKMKKLLWFSLLLVPVVFSLFVFEILKGTRPGDWDKHDSVTGTSMIISGQSVGVLLVAAILFVIRKWMTKLHHIPMLNPDVLALGLPLLINSAALAVILARYLVLPGLNEGDVILGPIPTNEVSVIEFYNVEFRNRSICVHSEYFGSLKVPPRQRASRVLQDPGSAVITFNVTLDPRTTPPIHTMGYFTYKKGIWITYVVTLPVTQIVGTDIEGFYSTLFLIRINKTDDIRPKKEPQVVFINTYVVFIDGWYYNITGPDTMETINQIYNGTSMTKSYPPGRLTITYWTEWIKLVKRGSHSPITIQLPVENYCVYTVILCLSSTMKDPSNYSELVPRMLQAHKTMEIAGTNSKQLPAKEELENDWALILGMTLAGMAKGGVYVGYIYSFWLDYPLSGFRTTFLAGFWILMAVPVKLALITVTDIGVTELIVLLVLQILFTALHFGSAVLLYMPEFNFRSRPV